MNNIIQIAKSYTHAGLSAIPTTADKRPACAWKAFTTRLPSNREIDVLFTRAEGIGIVCGKVSGNLELLDFDDRGSQFEPWFAKVPPYLKSRLVVESSPSGGKHVYYRVKDCDVPGNRKLALKPDQHVLIETRGEGGFVKCAPNSGYKLMQGDFLHLPTISPFEQKMLIDHALALNQHVANDSHAKSEKLAPAPSITSPRLNESSPIDDYNARADLPELISRFGWKRTGGPSDNEHWERPEKNENSTSATWNGSVFYVFSSNAAPFESGKGYNKFQVYALLEHAGDMSRAAHAIRNLGYGLIHSSSLTPHTSSSVPHPSSSPG